MSMELIVLSGEKTPNSEAGKEKNYTVKNLQLLLLMFLHFSSFKKYQEEKVRRICSMD